MDDTILIIFLILLLVFCCLYQANKPPISGVIIDKYIKYGFRGSGPFYYIVVETSDGTFSKSISHYDYENSYFIGWSYEF